MAASSKAQTRAGKSARRNGSSGRRPPARTTSARGSKRDKQTTSRTPERRPPIVSVLVITTLLLCAWALYPVLRLQYQQQREVASLEQELTGLKERNATLRSQVELLKTPAGVEQAARETLGLVKAGEQAYVVTGGSITGETRAPIPSHDTSETSAAQDVLDFIFGVK